MDILSGSSILFSRCTLTRPTSLSYHSRHSLWEGTGQWRNTTSMRSHDQNWRSSLTSVTLSEISRQGLLILLEPQQHSALMDFTSIAYRLEFLEKTITDVASFSEIVRSFICTAIFLAIVCSLCPILSSYRNNFLSRQVILEIYCGDETVNDGLDYPGAGSTEFSFWIRFLPL